MSLNWSLTNIANADTLCWTNAERDEPLNGIAKGDKVLHPVTNAIIWMTVVTGIGDLSAKHAPEFYARVRIYEQVCGAFVQTYDDATNAFVSRPLTCADIYAHIGLSTNVFPVESRTAWLKRLVGREMDNVASDFAREVTREIRDEMWKREHEASAHAHSD